MLKYKKPKKIEIPIITQVKGTVSVRPVSIDCNDLKDDSSSGANLMDLLIAMAERCNG